MCSLLNSFTEDMMKQLRQLCIGFVLILALSIPAFAGDIPSPGVTGQIPYRVTGDLPYGVTGNMPTGVTGEMPLGITGQIPGGDTGHIPGPGITGHIECGGIIDDLLSLLLRLFA
jgi:hypothetical protein